MTPSSKTYELRSLTLRIYTTASNQLAVFTNVESFRDLSLAVKVRKVTKTSKGKTIEAPGAYSSSSEVVEDSEWEEDALD